MLNLLILIFPEAAAGVEEVYTLIMDQLDQCMVQDMEEPVEVAPQGLTAPERTGFTVVEWGGAEVLG